MISNRNFSLEDIDNILKNMVILVDSREKSNKHILDWLDYKDRCEYQKITFSNGDYSCMLKACPEYGINEDIYFHKEFVIERKNSLDELSQNFTKNRARFEHELGTFNGRMIIAVEDTWSNLFQGNYSAKYNRKSFIGTTMAFTHRYGVSFNFLKKEEIGVYIYTQCRYYIREKLKNS